MVDAVVSIALIELCFTEAVHPFGPGPERARCCWRCTPVYRPFSSVSVICVVHTHLQARVEEGLKGKHINR